MPSQDAATKFSIQAARPIEDDAMRVMRWRNDPVTLASFYHREPKTWERFWPEFKTTYFQNPALPPLFILKDKIPVAFLRFQTVEDLQNSDRKCCDISINVDPALRGQGLAVPSLRLAATFLRAQGIDDVMAEIRVENTASVRSFQKAGYIYLDHIVKHIPDTGEDCRIFRYLLKGV